MKKYKLITGIGIAVAVTTPIVAVISCNDSGGIVTQADVNSEQAVVNGLTPENQVGSITNTNREELRRVVKDERFTIAVAKLLKLNGFKPKPNFLYTYSHDRFDENAHGSLNLTVQVKSLDGKISASNAKPVRIFFAILSAISKPWGIVRMTAEDALLQVLNSKQYGILPISSPLLAAGNDFYQYSYDKVRTEELINATKATGTDGKQKDAVKSFNFVKKDFLVNPTLYANAIAKDVHDFITKSENVGKRYELLVNTEKTTADVMDSNNSGVLTSGSFTLDLYEMKTATVELTDAIQIFKEDFGPNVENHLRKLGGTYIYSVLHDFMVSGNRGFDFIDTTITPKGDLNDRATEDNLLSWTGLGLKPNLTSAQIATIKQKLANIEFRGVHLVKDEKTRVFNVVGNVVSTVPNTTTNVATVVDCQTISIPVPEIVNWAPSTAIVDFDALAQTLYEQFTPKVFLSKILSLFSMVPDMDADGSGWMTPLKRVVMTVSENASFLRASDSLYNDVNFIRDLLTYIKTNHPDFSLTTFDAVVKNLPKNYLSSEWSLITIGAKTFSLIAFFDEFFIIAREYMGTLTS